MRSASVPEPTPTACEVRAVIGGELLLERLQLGPHQEPASIQHPRDGRVELGAASPARPARAR